MKKEPKKPSLCKGGWHSEAVTGGLWKEVYTKEFIQRKTNINPSPFVTALPLHNRAEKALPASRKVCFAKQNSDEVEGEFVINTSYSGR